MSKVRDNKRYAIPPIKQIDVTFFPSHVSVNQSQLILTARQKQKRKNKNKNKQTYQKRERQHLNLSCNILHDFVFFGIQWWRKNLRKRVRASTLRFLSTTRWGKLRTSSDVTLTRLFYVVFYYSFNVFLLVGKYNYVCQLSDLNRVEEVLFWKILKYEQFLKSVVTPQWFPSQNETGTTTQWLESQHVTCVEGCPSPFWACHAGHSIRRVRSWQRVMVRE